MHPLKLRPPVAHARQCERTQSCLTLNTADSILGLGNLLDLVHHEIIQEQQKHIHRLTFKSGKTLYIEADQQWITVRGSHINFRSPDDMPATTLLGDPARSKARVTL